MSVEAMLACFNRLLHIAVSEPFTVDSTSRVV